MREYLTSDRVYTIGKDFASVVSAYDTIRDTLDFGGKKVRVMVPSGSPGGTLVGECSGMKFAEDLSFHGIGGPVQCSAGGYLAAEGARFAVQDMTLTSPIIIEQGTVKAGGIWFDEMEWGVDVCGPTSLFEGIGPLTFLFRTFTSGFTAEDNGMIALPCPIVISGAPHFTGAFVQADWGGIIDATNSTIYPGSATGIRYAAYEFGMVFTGSNGGKPNYFPGNVAGVVKGGAYQ